LIIDTDAVLTVPAALQRFQMIARRYSQIVEDTRLIQHTQFSQGYRLNIRRELSAAPSCPDRLGFRVGEVAYHGGL
jgi:hypothetical protein